MGAETINCTDFPFFLSLEWVKQKLVRLRTASINVTSTGAVPHIMIVYMENRLTESSKELLFQLLFYIAGVIYFD